MHYNKNNDFYPYISMQTNALINLSKLYLEKHIDSIEEKEVYILQDIIDTHNNLYYNSDTPVISDFEYDMLLKKLQKLEQRFVLNLEQTTSVWHKVKQSTFEKVKHSRAMISLDNTYNAQDLRDFDERVKKNLQLTPNPSLDKRGEQDIDLEYMIEFKFDGVGIELIYEDGNFIQAITRWNGVEGEDVTENVRQIESIPKIISYTDRFEIRGEIVMPISSFEYLNKKAKDKWGKIFSNPRNAASGSIRMIDNSVTKERRLDFYGYALANDSQFIEENNITSYQSLIETIGNLWFKISSYFTRSASIENVISNIENIWEIKKTLDFEIDGLVIKLNNVELWSELGSTEHHPRYSIAYKFPAEILTTKVLSVQHSVGRTGTITPVANLEPVNIWWVTVRRATLHNYDEIESLWVKVGDTIFLKRAGEVIPKVVSVVSDARDGSEIDIAIPKSCPSCWEDVYKDEDKVRYYCANSTACPVQLWERLAWSIGKNGLDIDGFGEKQAKLFLELWFIEKLSDVFTLEGKREDILALEWFQEKSVDNLISAIEKAKKLDIAKLLKSLAISGVGKKIAKNLAKLFQQESDILEFPHSAEDIESIDDIWPEIALSVYEYFTLDSNKALLQELTALLDITYFQKREVWTWVFAGKKVCITGSFEAYKRPQLAEMLEKAWGEFMSSVSKKTDYLLAGDKTGSKLKKANELWVEVLDIDWFLENIAN